MTATKSVLIVEDEWIIAQDYAMALSDVGYVVVGPATTVDAAFRLLNAETVDMALLDINLNGEQSFPIAQELSLRGIPFVFVTSCSRDALPDGLRGSALLPKPISEAALVQTVRREIGMD